MAALCLLGAPGIASDAGLCDVARLAAPICRAPLGVVALVDGDAAWFGLRAEQQPSIDPSLYARAIEEPGGFAVSNPASDGRLSSLARATDHGVRFPHARPLIAVDGVPIDLVCVLDAEPRDVTPDGTSGVAALTHQAMRTLDLRRRSTAYWSSTIARMQTQDEIALLAQAAEQSPASIAVTGPLGSIEHVNLAFAPATGYGLDKVRGRNPRIAKSDETPAETHREAWEAPSSGRSWRGEFANRKKNGELFREYAVVSPVLDPPGATARYIAMKEDIIERKQTETGREAVIELLRIANADIGCPMRDFIQEAMDVPKKRPRREANSSPASSPSVAGSTSSPARQFARCTTASPKG